MWLQNNPNVRTFVLFFGEFLRLARLELLMQYNQWIAALCSTQGLNVNYQILMTNDDSNVMFRQFSADEFCKPIL